MAPRPGRRPGGRARHQPRLLQLSLAASDPPRDVQPPARLSGSKPPDFPDSTARAERELGREPQAYVAVAVVEADKREEQVGRWGWAGSADAGPRIAELGRRLTLSARGLRVRVHHDGGALVGSVLLRRARRAGAPPPTLEAVVDSGTDQRLATLEARLVLALKRIDDQTREISTLRAELGRVEHLPTAVTNMHHRLDAVEAVCERLEVEPAPAEERDEDEDEHDEDDDDSDDGYEDDDLDDGDDD